MLLSVALLQAKYSKTISKKDSFSLLKSEFPTLDTSVIDWASVVRMNWEQDSINFKTLLFHRCKKAGFPLSFLAPKTPENILVQLDEKWKQQVISLCKSLVTASN
ncbi:MAG: hypothetical protein IPO63_05665 [Bacteroidetes bacterium]|nr:hypothetical protein [Bacteroidota bacterium]